MTKHIARVLAAVLLSIWAYGAHAGDVIRSFNADILVREDGVLDVTETIKVNADGTDIQHGIYRDFPQYVTTPDGTRYKVSFEILSVTRNGEDEPWEATDTDLGTKIRIGDQFQLVSTGNHTYQIRYLTDRQIIFGDASDRLRWNVTGDEWSFPILSASAHVILSSGAQPFEPIAFIGSRGSKLADAVATVSGRGATFETTHALDPFEGLTIMVQLPKGAVAPPTTAQLSDWWWRDNLGWVVLIYGFAAVFAYMMFTWLWFGRDPKAGTIVPRWDLPMGISPALMSYIFDGTLRDEGKTALTATVLDLAVKGYVVLDGLDHLVTIRRTDLPISDGLPAGHIAILDMLHAHEGEMSLASLHEDDIEAVLLNFKVGVEAENDGRFYRQNKILFHLGIIISGAAAFAWLVVIDLNETAMKLVLFSSLTPLFLNAGIWKLLKSRRNPYSWMKRLLNFMGLAILAGMWVFGALLFCAMLYEDTGMNIAFQALLVVWGGVTFNQIFLVLIGSTTRAGAKIRDHITGLRLYLTVGEMDRMNIRDAPELSPAHFETLLPSAIALGIEKPWREAFRAHLISGQSLTGPSYAPSWFVGDDDDAISGLSRFAESVAASLHSGADDSNSSAGSGGGGGGGGGW